MKHIIFITICSFLSCNIIWGQCTPLQVSTNPENPFNYEVGQNVSTSPYLNNFDWQTPDYSPGNYVSSIVQSPFESTTNVNFFNKLSTDTGIKDYYVEDGWELLNENMIQTATNVDILYFTLYNKYSSVIRIFFAMDQPPTDEFTHVSVRLRFSDDEGINAMFHPSSGIAQPLDQKSEREVFVSIPRAKAENQRLKQEIADLK